MSPEVPKKRILVIDDEEIIRTCCMRTLVGLGYEVDAVGSGAEGLGMARTKRYDLVVTDLKMPNMDGIEVMNNIKKIQPGTKVIFITGYIAEGTREEVLAAGAFGCVEKPFDPEDLLRATIAAIG
jgi:two-component system chemotaxis response regulator CheY